MGTVTSSAGSTSPGLAARLESGRVFSGLSSSEAQRRLESGPNEIRREQATNALTLLVRQFASPVIWLLLVATVLSAALGEWLDAIAIGATVSTRPSGANAAKVRGISTMSTCSDCSDNRLVTLSAWPLTGFTADQPAAAPSADKAINTAIKPTKIKAGSGSALPKRSTPSRNRLRSSTDCGIRSPGKVRMT